MRTFALAVCGALAAVSVRAAEKDGADAYIARIRTLSAHVADGTMETRRTTAALLRGMGEPVLQYLEAELKAPGAERRARAALVLGEIGSPDALPLLLGALADREAIVRTRAAAAIGKMGKGETAEEIALLLDDADDGVRAGAARALGGLGASRFARKIESLLSDPSEKVRLGALSAAGNLGDRAAVPAAVRALDSPSAALRLSLIHI